MESKLVLIGNGGFKHYLPPIYLSNYYISQFPSNQMARELFHWVHLPETLAFSLEFTAQFPRHPPFGEFITKATC